LFNLSQKWRIDLSYKERKYRQTFLFLRCLLLIREPKVLPRGNVRIINPKKCGRRDLQVCLYLVNVETGERIWKLAYDISQKALTDNVTEADDFLNRAANG
jgi:hypothetical protein